MAIIEKALVRDVILLNITCCNSIFTDYLTMIKAKHFGIWKFYILNNFKLQIWLKLIDLVLTILMSHTESYSRVNVIIVGLLHEMLLLSLYDLEKVRD